MLSHSDLSFVQLFVTPWTATCWVPLSIGILQARILEWVASLSSQGFSQPRDQTQLFALQVDSLLSESQGKSCKYKSVKQSVQSLSHIRRFATPWTAAGQASLSITNSWSLLKRMLITLMMPSNHLILCHPLLLLPLVFLNIRVFSNESLLRIRWPKYWSFGFSISPSNEHPGLISFRMDWLDLLAVQGTLKSLLQHHSSKASILWGSAFFIAISQIHTKLLEKP